MDDLKQSNTINKNKINDLLKSIHAKDERMEQMEHHVNEQEQHSLKRNVVVTWTNSKMATLTPSVHSLSMKITCVGRTVVWTPFCILFYYLVTYIAMVVLLLRSTIIRMANIFFIILISYV